MISIDHYLKIFSSASFLLSIAVMAGRFSGFFREILLGGTFGISRESDAAVLLLTLPDLLVNIVLSGGLSVALMPIFKNEDKHHSLLIFHKVFCITFVVFSVFSLIIFGYPEYFFKVIAPGFNANVLEGDFYYFLVSISILLTALSGVTTVFLNSKKIFFIPGCGTLIFNVSIIIFLYFNKFFNGYQGVALGIFLGAIIRLLLQLKDIPVKANILFESIKVELPPGLKKDFIFGFLSMSFMSLIPVIMRSYASLLGDGYLTLFNYVFKLIELPLTVLVISLTTVAYPILSEYANRGDTNAASNTLSILLKKIFFSSCIFVAVSLLYAYQAFDLLFDNGKISKENILQMSDLFSLGILSTPFFGISYGLVSFLNSQKRTSYVLISNLIAAFFFWITCALSQLMNSSFLLMFSLISFSFSLMVSLIFGVYKDSQLKVKLNPKIFFTVLVRSLFLLAVIKFFLSNFGLSHSLIQLIVAGLFFLLVLMWGMNEISK
jgi:putative peptidoglycan lipid II flippase